MSSETKAAWFANPNYFCSDDDSADGDGDGDDLSEDDQLYDQSEHNENMLMQIALKHENSGFKRKRESDDDEYLANKRQKLQKCAPEADDESDSLGSLVSKYEISQREKIERAKIQKLKRRPAALRNPGILVKEELDAMQTVYAPLPDDLATAKYDYAEVPSRASVEKVEASFQSSFQTITPMSGKKKCSARKEIEKIEKKNLPIKINKLMGEERSRTRKVKHGKWKYASKEEGEKFAELLNLHQKIKAETLKTAEDMDKTIPMSREGKSITEKRKAGVINFGDPGVPGKAEKPHKTELKIAVINSILDNQSDGFSVRRMGTMLSRVRNGSLRDDDKSYWIIPYLTTRPHRKPDDDIAPAPFSVLRDIKFPMPEVITRAKANSLLRPYRDNEIPCVKGKSCCVFMLPGRDTRSMRCLPMVCTEAETQLLRQGKPVKRPGCCLLCYRKLYTSLFAHNMVFKTVAKKSNEPPPFYEMTEVPGEYPAEYSICSLPDVNMGFIHPIIAFNLFHYEFATVSGQVYIRQRIPTPKLETYDIRDPHLFSRKTLKSLEHTQEACQRYLKDKAAYPLYVASADDNPMDPRSSVAEPIHRETLAEKELRFKVETAKKKNRNLGVEELEDESEKHPISEYLYREKIEKILYWFWAQREALEPIYGKQELPERVRRHHEDIAFNKDDAQESEEEEVRPVYVKKKGNRRVKFSASKCRKKNSRINYDIGKIYPYSEENNFLRRLREEYPDAPAWVLAPFSEAVSLDAELVRPPKTYWWDPLSDVVADGKPDSIYRTLVNRVNWGLRQTRAHQKDMLDLWAYVDMHLPLALFYQTYRNRTNDLVLGVGIHRETLRMMPEFTPMKMYEPHGELVMHEGELPDLSFYIASAIYVSSDKMYIWNDDILSAIAEVFIKIAPIPCKRRSSEETFTRIVTRDPAVTNIFLRIIVCSLLGVYRHAKVHANFGLRMYLNQNFSFIYPKPIFFGEWMKKNSFLVIFIMREYFCFVFEKGLISLDEMHAKIYYWNKIKKIVYDTMDEVRRRLNQCFDGHHVNYKRFSKTMDRLNRVYLEKINKNKILPMSYRTPDEQFLKGVLTICKNLDLDVYAETEVDLNEHPLFDDTKKKRMREIISTFPKDSNYIRTLWLCEEFGMQVSTVQYFEHARLLYESETSRSAIKNVMQFLMKNRLVDYIIVKNYLEKFHQHCSMVFYRLPYHFAVDQVTSLKRMCRVPQGEELSKYAGSFYFDAVTGNPKTRITWEADDGRNMYCAGGQYIQLDPITRVSKNAVPPKKTTAKNRCVSIESIEEEMLRARRKMETRNFKNPKYKHTEEDQRKLDLQIKKLFYKKIQDLKRANEVLNHPLELKNMIGVAVRINSMNNVLLMCPVCTNLTAFDYRKFKGTKFGCCIPKNVALESVSFGRMYLLDPFCLYKTLKTREMEIPPSCYYCMKNLKDRVRIMVIAKDPMGNPSRIHLCPTHSKKWIVQLSDDGTLTIENMLRGIADGWYTMSFKKNGRSWICDPTNMYK